VVHAQPVHDALAREPQREPMRGLEHVGVLLPDGSQVVDVEEASVAARDRIHVEELPAQLRVGPPAVRVVRRHVVRHDVEHDPEAGAASRFHQRPELLLAAEGVGDAARVHHVVAVGRARPGLERGRQIEVRHAEVGEVRHELARGGETEVPRELQAVRGPQRGHAIRLTTVIERAVTYSSPRAS
jgi:hypothetical protein